jgi:outer membrane protein TolC
LSDLRSGPRRAQVAQARAELDASAYLTLVTSQTALLQTQLESQNLDTLPLSASVNLILALGGGWRIS